MQGKLILLVGESGSGKTTIAQELEKHGYHVVQSYTTRVPRTKNEWGHIFTTESHYSKTKALEEKTKKQLIVAETFFDGHHYWTETNQFEGHDKCLYIIDPPGLECLRKLVKDAEIIVFYLKTDEAERYARMIMNGRDITSISQRIRHDKDMFRIVDCDYCIDNNGDISKTIETIKGLVG